MATVDELLDALMKDYKNPEQLMGENGLLKDLTKRIFERAMQVEMTDHLGMKSTPHMAITAGIRVMEATRRPSKGTLALLKSQFHETATAVSSR